MSKTAKNPVKATETSLEIINGLRSLGRVGVSELADHLDLTKGTVHNHLSTLEEHGYVISQDDKYELGIRFFEVGQDVVRRRDIRKIAHPEIEELAEDTGEIANLMIEEQGRGIYLDIVKGDSAINIDTHVGSYHHLHTCALGKSILAHMPESRANEILDQDHLPQMTENTLTDREELFEELRTVRSEGVAYDGEERAKGIRCVAVPVRTNDGEILGAISITGPNRRLKSERVMNEITEKLKDAANIIRVNASFV